MKTSELEGTNDDRVRRVVQQSNPYRDVIIPPPAFTAAQLRMQAEHEAAAGVPWHEAISKRVNRRRLLVGGAATIGAAVAAYLFTPSAAIASPGQLDIDYSKPAQPAADQLMELARSIASEAGREPAEELATHVHLQRWSMDTIDPAAELVAQDIQTWWNPDHSGRELITTLPSQPSGRRVAKYLDQLPPGSAAVTAEYGPGEFKTLIGTPSADPQQLKTQLDSHEPPANGPQATLRAVADVTALHYLGIAQRIAFLVVLAGIPGLVWRGNTSDRAERPCLAFSIDSGEASTGRQRDILLVGTTGQVLSHEIIALTPPPRSPIGNNTIIEYELHLPTE